MNGLRGIDVEVIQIGDKTCGKPYGFYPQDNCGTTYFSIQFSGINSKGFGDYADGFKPSKTPVFAADVKGCPVADDFSRALGDPEEHMLRTALHHINSATCLELPVRTLALTAPDLENNAEANSAKASLAVKDPATNTINNTIRFPIYEAVPQQ